MTEKSRDIVRQILSMSSEEWVRVAARISPESLEYIDVLLEKAASSGELEELAAWREG